MLALIDFYTLGQHDLLQAREGSVRAGEVKGGVDVKVNMGQTHGGRAQVLPQAGWAKCAQSCSILTQCKCVCGERWYEGTPSAAPPGSSSRKTDLQQQQHQQQHEQPATSFGASGSQTIKEGQNCYVLLGPPCGPELLDSTHVGNILLL